MSSEQPVEKCVFGPPDNCPARVVIGMVAPDQVWRGDDRRVDPACEDHAVSYLVADTDRKAKVLPVPGHNGSFAVVLRRANRLDELPFPWPPEDRK